jgi:hypothetical protein
MAFRLQWPTKSRYITQNFGANYDYYMRWNLPGHEGLDIGTKVGDEVYACADGTVYMVGRDPKGHNYGIHVRIKHKDPDGVFKTTYAHLQEALVQEQQTVKAGQLIGKAGITGNTTGPHLHMTLKKVGATKQGESTYLNERGQRITMPEDIIDPTPFFDPQPTYIPCRPVSENHPANALLGGKQYIPYNDPDIFSTQPIALPAPEKVLLIFDDNEDLATYQINHGVTITLPLPLPSKDSSRFVLQENGRDYDLILADGVKITFHGALPWLGDTMRVSSEIGLRVRGNATVSSKELTRLPNGFELVLSSSKREGGVYVWRQIVSPERYSGVEIKDGWVAERSLDNTQIYLVYV